MLLPKKDRHNCEKISVVSMQFVITNNIVINVD